MSPIRIPITEEREKTPMGVLLRILSSGFVLGLLVGTIPIQSSLINNAGDFIASVGGVPVVIESAPPIGAVVGFDTPPAVQDLPIPTSASDAVEDADADVAGDTASTPPLVPISPNVNAREERIAQLSREIVRIKDASVALIAEFNQNCGAWTDECATPYASALEKNNIAYDQVARELEATVGNPP